MRVLVTGGAGFIGTHSVRALLARGHDVTVVDDLSHGRRETVPSESKSVEMDVRSPDLFGLFESAAPEAVLHLAAQMDVRKSVADPLYDASINERALRRILREAESSRAPGQPASISPDSMKSPPPHLRLWGKAPSFWRGYTDGIKLDDQS